MMNQPNGQRDRSERVAKCFVCGAEYQPAVTGTWGMCAEHLDAHLSRLDADELQDVPGVVLAIAETYNPKETSS